MLVSIVVPTLNEPGIGAALAGVRSQELTGDDRFELIVVGRDEAGRIRPGADLRFLDSGRPVPPALARNLGAAQAGGEVLCFLDADCVPLPGWLAGLAEAFRDGQAEVVGGGVAFETGRYWSVADNIATFYPYLSSRPAGEREQLPTLNLAVRREAWERVGGFDERYPYPAGEDSDWCLRARSLGYVLAFRPELAVLHRPSRTTARAAWRHAVRFGASSVKVDPRHAPVERRPWPLRRWQTVLATAPVLAAGVTARAFLADPALWRHWPALPAVYLAKLGWCWGAAGTLRRGAPWTQGP